MKEIFRNTILFVGFVNKKILDNKSTMIIVYLTGNVYRGPAPYKLQLINVKQKQMQILFQFYCIMYSNYDCHLFFKTLI